MKLITGPHELLVRFGRDRRLQGYHLILVNQACNDDGTPVLNADGSVFLEKFSEALTIEQAVAAGLGLSDLEGLISETLAQALADRDHQAAMAQAKTTEAAETKSALDQAVAHVASLKERLAQAAEHAVTSRAI